jgi:hypothetical protein
MIDRRDIRQITMRALYAVLAIASALCVVGCLAPPPQDNSGDASLDVTTDTTDRPEAAPMEDAPADSPAIVPDASEAGPPACGPGNCPSGCCDTNGMCQLGTDPAACGSGGVACASCATGQACTSQACSCDGNGGCAGGCCTATGQCMTSSTTSCGQAGAVCVACVSGQECSAQGKCVCDATSCPNGCCNGDTCVPYAMEDATKCGVGGAACAACAANQACNAAGACTCTAASCPNGCCSGDTCVLTASQSTTMCGSGGNACGACAGGQACSAGACSCGGTSCTGCCNAGSCEAYAGQSATSCGTSGAACSACSITNANPACTSGACTLSSCKTGFGNCDSNAANGCETNLNTSSTYCGACGAGHACPTGGSCTNGVCACPGGQTNCSGTCTNTQASDAANCGSCGHGCIGGTCSAGVCQRFTVANATVTSSPVALAADATNLYWLDNGLNAVLQVPVAQPGSKPITLATLSTPVYFQGIAVGGSTVVFTSDDKNYPVTGQLWTAKVGVANQSLTAIDTFSGIQTIAGPALSSAGTTAYIVQDPLGSGSNPTVTKVEACTFAANGCTVLTTVTSNEISNPVVSGSYLFFGDYGTGVLQRYTLPSGPLNSTWNGGESEIQGLAADATRVFWQYNGDGTSTTVTVAGAVSSAANGSAVPLGFGNLTGAGGGLASDGKFAYFGHYVYTTNPNVGSVQYAPVTGGAVSTLYTGTAPRGVIASNGGIYWFDGPIIYGQRFP